MIWTTDTGGWIRQKVSLEGSFRIDGTSNPDQIRDGNSNAIGTVVRVSAGLFTVTFATVDQGGPSDLPEKIVTFSLDISQAAAPSAWVKPHLVIDSYSQATRSFQIQCWDSQTPSATDPDDNNMISFTLCGSICSTGTD